MIFTVDKQESGQRLDVFCVGKLPHLSRSAIQKAIKEGVITLNDQDSKPRQFVREGDKIAFKKEIAPPPAQEPLEAPKIPILYEDKDVVVMNKPAGVETHPGQVPGPTVTAWFTERYPQSANVGEDPSRPGVVHRLDKDTSGVLILAKTPEAYTHLKQQFQKHHAKKEYLALVFGVPGEPEGRITRPLSRSKRNPLRRTVDLEGKPAITEWRKEEVFGSKFALLRVFPLTGRTHQIRVHMHFLGFPIVGDPLYTFKRKSLPRTFHRKVRGQILHAEKLTIALPSGKKRTFTAELPKDFVAILASLRGGRPLADDEAISRK